jgi:hypothetical protein
MHMHVVIASGDGEEVQRETAAIARDWETEALSWHEEKGWFRLDIPSTMRELRAETAGIGIRTVCADFALCL